MTVSDLESIFDYHYWASHKLLGVVSQLTTEQFTRTVAGAYRSVRNTLVHTLSAEWGWLDRCGGHKRGAPLNADDYPTVASLVYRCNEIEWHMREYLSRLSEPDLDRIVEFSFGSGPAYAMTVCHLLRHSANHAVHHRGQVALMLRELGVVPGNFDFLFYPGPALGGSKS
jgi:uncharacterized damage-inducible protein DinB